MLALHMAGDVEGEDRQCPYSVNMLFIYLNVCFQAAAILPPVFWNLVEYQPAKGQMTATGLWKYHSSFPYTSNSYPCLYSLMQIWTSSGRWVHELSPDPSCFCRKCSLPSGSLPNCENCEKKNCSRIVCSMNVVSQINSEIQSPQILQSHHKLLEKNLSWWEEKAQPFFPWSSEIFTAQLFALTYSVWIARVFHLLLMILVLWLCLSTTRTKVYWPGDHIKREPRRLWKNTDIKKLNRKDGEDKNAKRERKF